MRARVGVVLVLLVAQARAAPRLDGLHPVVAAMPAHAETSIEAVAHYIANRVLDPIDRIKALHDWVADRIAYDARVLRSDVPIEDAVPDEVFRNRIGVCAGYARLLERLGAAIDIPIKTVHGATSQGMHAWNVVEISGRRLQIDATWDAGYVRGARFIKEYSTEYFLFAHRADHGPYEERAPNLDDYRAKWEREAEERLRAWENSHARDAAWAEFREASERERAAAREALDWASLGL